MNTEGLFKADKVTGLGGSIFALSVCLEVVRQNNIRHPFKFPFYGLSFDDASQYSEEWIDERKYNKVVDSILAYIAQNGMTHFEETRKEVVDYADRLYAYAHEVVPMLSNLSNFELVQKYAEFVNIYCFYFGLGAVALLYESNMSARLNASISARYPNVTDIINSNLEQPYKSFMIEDEEHLLKIKYEKDEAKKKKLIVEYQKKFFFIKSNFSYSSPLSEKQVIALAEAVSEHGGKKTKPDIGTVELTSEEKNILALFKETEIIRDQRKRTNYIGNFVMFRFLEEASRRNYCSISIARRMFWTEFSDFVLDYNNLVKRLKERTTASVILDGENTYYFDYNAIESRTVIDTSVEECKGTSACKGKITGRVNIILTTADFPKFKKGDVLVTEMTRPEFVPLMKEAAAIITDEGGLTCHAAIVSRELNTPCIVGTKIATRIFKDGDMIEVDADKGTTRKILL